MKLFIPKWLVAILLTAAIGTLGYLSLPTRPEVQFRAGASRVSSAVKVAYRDLQMMESETEGTRTGMDSRMIHNHIEGAFDPKTLAFIREEFIFAIVENPSPDLAILKNQVIATLAGRDKVVLFYGDGREEVFHEPGAIQY